MRAREKREGRATRGPALPDQREGPLRSLGVLEKETDTWMNKRDCNGCHHVPEMLWTYREAQRRGVAVEQSKFDELLEWAVAREKKSGPTLIRLMIGVVLLAGFVSVIGRDAFGAFRGRTARQNQYGEENGSKGERVQQISPPVAGDMKGAGPGD